MNIEYKGFTIVASRVYSKDFRFYVKTCGVNPFNPKGYATLNNAKGAITKHLQAFELRAASAVKAPAPEVMKKAALAFGDSMFKRTVSAPVRQSRNKREGRYAGKRPRLNGQHSRNYRTGPTPRYQSL